MRDLIATRQSHYTDGSTSIERQRESGKARSASDGGTPVAVTEDVDVSGAVSPFDRPDLGPWLTDPEKIGQWDRLIVTKLDRLSRSLSDLDRVVKWCQANDKILISIGESIDMSTAAGRMFVMLLGIFAQFERERMSERRSEAAAKLRTLARWGGGPVCYGYRGEKNTGEVVPDPVTAPIVVRMAEMAIAGTSAAAIARWLNSEHVPTPQGNYKRSKRMAKDGPKWRTQTVIAILRNPGLRGYVVQIMPDGSADRFKDEHGKLQPKIMRDEDGSPIRREAILDDDDTWHKLQAALDDMSQNRTRTRSNAHPLLGAAFCGKCGAALYALRQTNARWCYYVCSRRQTGDCDARGVPMADLDARIVAEIIAAFSQKPYPEKIVTPGVDHERELQTIDRQIAELDQAHESGELHTRAYSRQVSKLEAVREALEAEEAPGGVEYRDADDTIAERFTAADLDGRRAILLDLGITFTACLIARGQLDVDMQPPERLSA